MSSSTVLELIAAGIALIVVAIASWVETSLAAASRVNLRRLFDERYARIDEHAVERAQRLRGTMPLLAVLAGGIAAALIADACESAIESWGFGIGLGISAALLIIVARIAPRVVAGIEPDSESARVRRAAAMLSFLFAPITRPVEALVDVLMRGEREREEISAGEHGAEELSVVVTSAAERVEGEIEEDEQDMISGVLHLERATARDIMVPRIDIVAVSRDVLVSEAVDVAISAGHSRIPVYGRNIDDILGVIYAKDLLKYVNEEHEGVTVGTLMRKAYFVPESKRVDDLLNELQQAKVHLAVVVDEYGGTAGVVTIEDILEEIVGEIQDEYDREQPRIEILGEGVAVSDGAVSVDDLSDELDIEWPEPVSGTVGGFIQRHLGRIPAENEVVRVDGIRLTVLRVEHRRVRQVRIERIHQPLPDDDAAVTTVTSDATG